MVFGSKRKFVYQQKRKEDEDVEENDEEKDSDEDEQSDSEEEQEEMPQKQVKKVMESIDKEIPKEIKDKVNRKGIESRYKVAEVPTQTDLVIVDTQTNEQYTIPFALAKILSDIEEIKIILSS